jgi:hypothetical protein
LWSVENLNRREIPLEVEHVKSSDARLQGAVFRWLPKLAKIEGWEDWKRQVTGSTMWFDDPWPSDEEAVGDFKLPEDLDLQHAVVVKYFALHSTLVSLRDCEYYFRRYPFGGLPVQRHDHLRYICEMYFGRFYEFKERSKECFKAINATLPAKKKLDPGSLIKVFDKEVSSGNS